jgi:8-oxo-dGTP pyrophosphatase MutT (NUDIX family)
MAFTEISAGGVIYRENEDGVEVCLITCRGKKRWQLPKGWVEPGETHEQAAKREVREETGLVGEIETPLESIDFWYLSKFGAKPERRHKYVHHYLLRYIQGETKDHDHEVDEARWFPIDRALALLSFPNERSVMARAFKILEPRHKKTGT